MIKKALDFLSSDIVLLGAWMAYLVLILIDAAVTNYQVGEYFWSFSDVFAAAFLAIKFWFNWRHKI